MLQDLDGLFKKTQHNEDRPRNKQEARYSCWPNRVGDVLESVDRIECMKCEGLSQSSIRKTLIRLCSNAGQRGWWVP